MDHSVEQHDIKFSKRSKVFGIELHAVIFASMAVSLLGVLDVLKVDIGADVVDIRQVLDHKAGTTAHVQHSHPRFWFGKLVNAGFSRFLGTHRSLNRQVNRRKFEQRFHHASEI